jgi:hypothetical protein
MNTEFQHQLVLFFFFFFYIYILELIEWGLNFARGVQEVRLVIEIHGFCSIEEAGVEHAGVWVGLLDGMEGTGDVVEAVAEVGAECQIDDVPRPGVGVPSRPAVELASFKSQLRKGTPC